MNQKELAELRRRFRPDRSAITHIYGCYVNTAKEIIAPVDASLAMLTGQESEQFLGLLRRVLTGTLGRNLLDISFTTRQVAEGEEHALLSTLRRTALQDVSSREAFCRKIIDVLDMDCNYLILLAHDSYDVPHRGKDDWDLEDDSDNVFSYLVCSICPVKDGKPELSYSPSRNEFHTATNGQIVAPPELGFLFPAFDDRAANLYSALYYIRKPENTYQPFLDAVFHTGPLLSAPAQKEAFSSALQNAMEDECPFQVVQAVHEQLRERIVQHRESRDPEPLTVTPGEVEDMLSSSGLSPEQVSAFRTSLADSFGEDTPLSPANLIDSSRFRVSTPNITITVTPSQSHLVTTRVLDGRKYILIPADSGVEINGVVCEVE